MNISYTITVYNELEEIERLLQLLQLAKSSNDEIIVVHTYREEKEQNTETDKKIQELCKDVEIYKRYHFDNKFAEMKNFTNSLATKDYIINLDADEFASVETINIWREAINADNDLYHLPRVNTVTDYTLDDVKKYNWQINTNGWINWPDYQPRIYKNNGNIKWIGNVHEQLTGFTNAAALPANPQYAIIHHKAIEKQRSQNTLYENITR
jgi:hypothetical protein|tara:strand:- start:7562 stop:8191 length:630 start_codon:yes stop_codon:yes gene_type:complete